MRKLLVFLLVFWSFAFMAPAAGAAAKPVTPAPVKTVLGIDRVQEYHDLLDGKRVGLFTNQTGVNSNLESSVDVLKKNFNLTAVYVPEHGLFGAVDAGEKFNDETYEGIPIISLYGESRKPTQKMLDKIDVMCVDIQDIGARHYTYFSSLAYIMQACARTNKPVVVFDRPNPLGGTVQGPVLKPEYKSFIGLYEIPLRHGLTIGEFARYINEKEHIQCPLEVVPLKHWHRHQHWSDTGLPWTLTSPLIPTADTGYYYIVTGVIGDTVLSNGIGTAKPFYFVGAPFINGKEFKNNLEKLAIPGVKYRQAAYKPRYGKNKGEVVHGVELYLLQPKTTNLPELQYRILYLVKQMYPDKMTFPERGHGAKGCVSDIGLGEDSIRQGEAPEKAFARWQEECKKYSQDVKPYLLYK